jgi:hypothetical protein
VKGETARMLVLPNPCVGDLGGYSGFYASDFGNVLDVCGEKEILIGVYGIANPTNPLISSLLLLSLYLRIE